jgi:hypothetical protein
VPSNTLNDASLELFGNRAIEFLWVLACFMYMSMTSVTLNMGMGSRLTLALP